MTMHFITRDLLEAETGAMLLTVDGNCVGLEGGIARSFAQRHPQIWQSVLKQVSFPIALGDTDAACITKDDGGQQLIILGATLHHLLDLGRDQKQAVVRSVLTSALKRTAAAKISDLGVPILSGGWRLSAVQAANSMSNAYFAALALSQHVPDLFVHVIQTESRQELFDYFRSRSYLNVQATDNGFTIHRS
ncbi:MAG: hypothetical protein R3C28_26685 [Pirellulaceae bacterium]